MPLDTVEPVQERRRSSGESYAHPVAEDVEALVEAAAAGDARAWSSLVSRFSGLVWSIARSTGLDSSDAADVSQTTWLRLAEHLHNLHDASKIGAWLATTARRESIRVAKLGVREVLIDPWAALDTRVNGDADPDAGLIARARDITVQEALGLLPERNRALLLALSEDPPMSYEEISRIFGIPIGSIGPTRARCLAKLRALLAQVEAGAHADAIAGGDS